MSTLCRLVDKILERGRCSRVTLRVQAQVKEAEEKADKVLDVLLTDLASLIDETVREELLQTDD